MAVDVYISIILREICGGRSSLSVEADSIKTLVEEIDREYPGFRSEILTPDGHFLKNALISVNGEKINMEDEPEFLLESGDQVFFLMPVAGG